MIENGGWFSNIDNANDFKEGYIVPDETKRNITLLEEHGEHILSMCVQVREIVETRVTDDFFD